jgi:transcriptional antiterminator NusG
VRSENHRVLAPKSVLKDDMREDAAEERIDIDAFLDVGGDIDKQWYVIHTYSGYENKVKANLERRVESMGMEDKIFRVLVPTEEEIAFKDGKKCIVKKKVFPGYVLVEMVMSDDSWYVVRNTPGVTGFVGSGSKPIALEREEVKAILKQMGFDEGRPRVALNVGDAIRVLSGPFANFDGEIEEVNIERGKVRVVISMFGRDTPIELDFEQVEKLS